MANNKEKLSMWERTEYDIISETETATGITGIIRNRYNGATIICNIPKHTKEEEEKLTADITYALMQIAFTGQDISHMKNMEIIID
jgi:hypothetical protein